jgi:hypothetical protein
MRIARFAEIPASAWNEVASISEDAWMLHRAEWIDIEALFFVEENHSFGLVSEDQLIGILPLYLASAAQTGGAERLLHSGIHRHTGLALRPGLSPRDRRAAQSAAMARVFSIAEALDVDRIGLNVHNLAPVCFTPKRPEIPFWVTENGFRLGLNLGEGGVCPSPGLSTCFADQIVHLGQPVEAMFGRLEESCRRAIRKATRYELTFRVAHAMEELDVYLNLAQRSAARTGEALPPREYYQGVLSAFGHEQTAGIAFVEWRDLPIAAVFFLNDRQSVSFLAGVSDPAHLDKRCNDFAHWNLMLWAKERGCLRYRFGPFFPELSAEWPVSRVSKFKTKFGSDSYTTIQGSLFRHPEHYREAAHAYVESLCMPTAAPRTPDLPVPNAEVVRHHLSLFGVGTAQARADGLDLPLVIDRASGDDVGQIESAVAYGRTVIALNPSARFCKALGVTASPVVGRAPSLLQAAQGRGHRWGRLRTLHPYLELTVESDGPPLEPVLVNERGMVVWAWVERGPARFLLIGTHLAKDLVRYRQGDPSAVLRKLERSAWGFGSERPVYLFEEQLAGEAPEERHADWWCWALREALRRKGIAADPIFPGDAPGVVIVSGDDDQAYLETYEAQLAALGSLPITYFLHPLTRHDADSMRRIFAGRRVDLGLHPDALDAPHRYADLLAEQARWFEQLVGGRAVSLRNHGFLNDGYWGHAPAWLASGLAVSSNLPGLDGRMLNGSLLPAKLVLGGQLVDHWSVLTAIGDGVAFGHGKQRQAPGDVVRELGRNVRSSGVPGAIVLNLHPQNIELTRDMHAAVHELVADGFLAWTLKDLIDWFVAREAGTVPFRSSAQAA